VATTESQDVTGQTGEGYTLPAKLFDGDFQESARQIYVDLLDTDGKTAPDIAQSLGRSEEAVQRDLDALLSAGLVSRQRTRGLAKYSVVPERSDKTEA